MVIHNFETERFCLAGLLRFPKIFSDIDAFITDYDFVSKLNRTVFSVIKSFLSKGQELNDFLIAEKVKNLNIRFDENDLEILDFIESLRLLQVSERSVMALFQELKRTTVRREISETAVQIQKSMASAKDASIEEILQMADLAYSEKLSLFESNQDFVNIYDSLQQKIEERGENPVGEIGFMGPFPKINELYGSLLRDGAITVLGARTGIGKTSMGMFYLNHVAERYNIPILHLDQGEMSIEELQYRSVSMFTQGRVSYDALEHGYWRKNAEMTQLVREVWPRVKAMQMFYYDVSSLSPREIISLIRRFFLRKIGRGNKFLTHYDYLKAFDLDNTRSSEWQMMGQFLKEVKAFYKNELNNSFWTSVQLNRLGIVGNKNASQIDDTENTFGVSDRISQQSTHSILMRPKTLEEIAVEANQYGNVKAVFPKHRHLGRNAHDALTPVKLPNGQFHKNFIHLLVESFYIKELGDLASTAGKFGQIKQHQDDHSGQLEDPDVL